MNPYVLSKPYRYLFNYGKHHNIEELKLNPKTVESVYHPILKDFCKNDKCKKLNKYANKRFEEFKIHVSKTYKKPPIKYCNKRRYTKFETAGKKLARCILSWDSRRTERNRYWCETCKAYHLTSKSYE